MFKKFNSFFCGFIACAVLTTAIGVVFADSIEVEFNKVNLTVNGKKIGVQNILYDGTTYVPMRAVAESLGKFVGWDESSNTASINDTPQTAEASQEAKTGSIKGVITWQYSNYDGTKGDVDAKIALIPKDLKPSTEDELFCIDLSQDPQGKNGIYSTSADGYGSYIIQNARVGNYHVIVKSKNAHRLTSKNKTNISDLQTLFTEKGLGYIEMALTSYKYTIKSISIHADETVTVNHDFGNSEY